VNIYSPAGIVFIFGLYYAPYVFLFVHSALTLMNPELEEAVQVHGGSLWKTLTRVTFPLVKPALLGSGILVFMLITENFPVPQILGSPSRIETLPSYIFRLMSAAPPRSMEASTAGVLMMVVMFVLVFVQTRMLARREYVTVTGKGFRPHVVSLGRWRWAGLSFALVYLLLAVVLPFFALAQSALRKHQFIASFGALFDPAALSLQNLHDLVMDYEPFRMGLKNSLIVGVLTAGFGGALHIVLSYLVHRTQLKGRRSLEYIAMLPSAVPGLVMGMGFLWAWLMLPLPIYGTLAILVFAYAARFMPQGFRGISSTILQVHRDLEDSAYIAGASRVRAAVRITVPLIRTGVISTMLLLFILSMRELSTSIFLFTSDTRILSVVLYDQWESGFWPRAAGISILYSILLLVLTVVGRRWFNIRGG
jgi:iron(III) transport system permease protein